jgi:hypothetical protein
MLPGAALVWAGVRLHTLTGPMRAGWRGSASCWCSCRRWRSPRRLAPLEADTEATGSRLHVLAWMLWWIAFVPSALLLALGARRSIGFALACLAAALLVPLLAVFAPIGPWVSIAQRLAFALWFGWWRLAICASASGPGSSRTAGT